MLIYLINFLKTNYVNYYYNKYFINKTIDNNYKIYELRIGSTEYICIPIFVKDGYYENCNKDDIYIHIIITNCHALFITKMKN